MELQVVARSQERVLAEALVALVDKLTPVMAVAAAARLVTPVMVVPVDRGVAAALTAPQVLVVGQAAAAAAQITFQALLIGELLALAAGV
jgi:hypothetical protein